MSRRKRVAKKAGVLTGSASLTKFNPGPTVAARTGLPTTVVIDEFVLGIVSVSFAIGKSTPAS